MMSDCKIMAIFTLQVFGRHKFLIQIVQIISDIFGKKVADTYFFILG